MTTLGILLTAMFGAGVGLITYQVRKWWDRRHIGRFNRWLEELEAQAIQVIQDDARAAESKANLFALIGELPADFDPTIFLTCKVAEGLHRAVLLEAERRGLVTAGTFERVYGLPNLMPHQPGPPGSPPTGGPDALPVLPRSNGQAQRPPILLDPVPQSFIGTAPSPPE